MKILRPSPVSDEVLARVSNVDAFRKWRLTEDVPVSALVQSITGHVETESMRVGTAFHKAMECASYGPREVLRANGCTFVLPVNAQVRVPIAREIRKSRVYGSLRVTGKVDAICGSTIWDHKTTARFDAERYIEGYQWRYYLDIFGCDEFVWNLFEMKADTTHEDTFIVTDVHYLSQYRYPSLHADCLALALEYAQFADRHLNGYTPDVSDDSV